MACGAARPLPRARPLQPIHSRSPFESECVLMLYSFQASRLAPVPLIAHTSRRSLLAAPLVRYHPRNCGTARVAASMTTSNRVSCSRVASRVSHGSRRRRAYHPCACRPHLGHRSPQPYAPCQRRVAAWAEEDLEIAPDTIRDELGDLAVRIEELAKSVDEGLQVRRTPALLAFTLRSCTETTSICTQNAFHSVYVLQHGLIPAAAVVEVLVRRNPCARAERLSQRQPMLLLRGGASESL